MSSYTIQVFPWKVRDVDQDDPLVLLKTNIYNTTIFALSQVSECASPQVGLFLVLAACLKKKFKFPFGQTKSDHTM